MPNLRRGTCAIVGHSPPRELRPVEQIGDVETQRKLPRHHRLRAILLASALAWLLIALVGFTLAYPVLTGQVARP